MRVFYAISLAGACSKIGAGKDWQHKYTLPIDQLDIQFIKGSIQLPLNFETIEDHVQEQNNKTSP